jgi:Peptidase family M50.
MEILLIFLIAILCYWISGIVHELGHVLTGLANGWKFHLLVVGPLGIKTNGQGKIKLYFEKHIAMWGGAGATIPDVSKPDNTKAWSKILLGGPLASMLMGVIFLPPGIITKNITLLLLGAMPLGMGIMCILPLPIKTGITYSDGWRWNRLHKGGQEADEEIALFKLMENEIAGENFSKIDYKHIESLLKSNETSLQYYGYYYKFKYYKSRNNEEEMKLAITQMEELKTRVSPIIVNGCKID